MQIPFVIQFHSGYGRDHYDLMIRQGAALATWQLPISPNSIDQTAGVATAKLPDHRLAYLTYEGPVSKSRGEVKLWDSGTCELLEATEGRWRVQFNGSRLRGQWELLQREADWLFRPMGA